MASRLKRAHLRAAVATAVVALPLLAAGSAQAGIAGSNPATTSNPDAISATVLSGASGTSAGQVELCYDKAVNATGTFTAQSGLGGYRSGRLLKPSSVVPETGKPTCLLANFPQNSNTNQVDLGQFTVYETSAGVVSNATGGGSNLADSVTLNVPNAFATHNGTSDPTTGHSTGPDLAGAVISSPTTVVFTLDQNVDNSTKPPVPGNFFLEDASGNICRATAIASVSGANVTATFPSSPAYYQACNANNAVRAGIDPAGVFAAADTNSANPRVSTVFNGGTTQLADLISAVLGTNLNTINYTFNKPVNAATVNAAQFEAWLANGTVLVGQSASVTSSTAGSSTIAVTFANLAQQAEYGVIAAVRGNAVQASGNPSGSNGCNVNGNTNTNSGCATGAGTNSDSPGSAPIGDNSGAFARGFTTGGDAFSVTINKTNAVVSITLDQRVNTIVPGQILLLNNQGQALSTFAAAASSSPASGNPPANPGQETITFQFNPAQVQNASAIQILPGAFVTQLSNSQVSDSGNSAPPPGTCNANSPAPCQGAQGGDAGNVPQILAPVAPAARIKAATIHHKKKHALKKH